MAERPGRITGPNGKGYLWQPSNRNVETFEKLGEASGFASREDAERADFLGDDGSYVQENYTNANALLPKLMYFGMLAGPAIAHFAPMAFQGAGTGAGGGTGVGAGGGTATTAASSTLGTSPMAGVSFGPGVVGSVGGPGVSGGVGGGGAAGTIGTLGKLKNVGQALLGYSSGAAQGRQAEANLNLGTDTLRQRQAEQARQDALDRAKLEMDQRTTGQDLETQARQQAAWGQFVSAGPRKLNVPSEIAANMGTFASPSPESAGQYKDMGDQAYRAAMDRLLSGSDKKFTPPPSVPTPPLTPQPNESWLEKLMRWGGTGLGVAGGFSGYQPPKERT